MFFGEFVYSHRSEFSAGLWGAIAGGWQGFIANYEKIYNIRVGNYDIIYYKPDFLYNLPG